MPYQFPIDIQKRVQARIKSGQYQDEDELLRDAMDALENREQEKLFQWQARNRISAEQSQKGLSKPLNDDEVLKRLHDQFEKSTGQ